MIQKSAVLNKLVVITFKDFARVEPYTLPQKHRNKKKVSHSNTRNLTAKRVIGHAKKNQAICFHDMENMTVLGIGYAAVSSWR
jgi:hypothetical protein